MMITVSVSEFRNNLASYLSRVLQGTKLLIKDDKRKVEFAEVKRMQTFDKESYLKALERARGTFAKERHPEWASLKRVESWLRSTRRQSDRIFKI